MTGSSLLSNSEPEVVHASHEKYKPKNEKVKKNSKVQKKEKPKNADKTKSNGFRRRFLSLFCRCFQNQERNYKNGEMEQSATKKKIAEKDNSQSSFVTIDLND